MVRHDDLVTSAFAVLTCGAPIPRTGDTSATSQSDLDSFNHDWMGKYFGTSKVVLKPRSTEQVSKVVAYCVKVRSP